MDQRLVAAESGASREGQDTEAKPVGVAQVLRHIFRLAGPFFCGRNSWCKAWRFAAFAILLSFVQTTIMVSLASLVRHYNNALMEKNVDDFWTTITQCFVVIAVSIPVVAAGDWVKGGLAYEWRRCITHKLLEDYIGEEQAYYRLKFKVGELDNPDERIAQDVGEFTQAVTGMALTLFTAVLNILGMSAVLINISMDLFILVVVFSLVTTVVFLVVFGRPLVRVQRQVRAKEATLRFGLVRVREHAESIAFYQGATFERLRSGMLLTDTIAVLYRRLCLLCTFAGLRNACTIGAAFLPALILAPGYFEGRVEFGEIGQAGMAFNVLLGAMTSLMTKLESLSNIGASAVRVGLLWDELARVNQGQAEQDSSEEGAPEGRRLQKLRRISLAQQPSPEEGAEAPDEPTRLRLRGVTLRPPGTDVPLVQGLSFELSDGESLIITGSSGIGKSSLLRAIGGLWADGSGSIERCCTKECFFLPQDPYMCLGSLRDNVLYPAYMGFLEKADTAPGDDDICAALAQVGIEHLAARYGLNTTVDFDTVLSGGEKQRLSFVRLLLQQNTRLVVLDEATSCLDEENEAKLYALVRKKCTCYVSVAHRPNLHKLHTKMLHLTRQPLGVYWSVTRVS